MSSSSHASLVARIEGGTASLGVIGLGYVGLPLAVEMARSGYPVWGFDVSKTVVDGIRDGTSHIQDVPTEALTDLVSSGRIQASCEFDGLASCDVISICVPTPLNKIKDPDLSYVASAVRGIAGRLRPGQLIILESTTYPGTTREVVTPMLEETGLAVGEDFFVCYSPERVDPGNPVWHTRNTPKVLGGITTACTTAGERLYGRIFDQLVRVESADAAELVKVYENSFRMINIALANELAQACDRLGVNVWNVIDAAATKPFGFMKFTPGPGLGGHCIPLDPHYLAWKMRTLAYRTRLIDLASEINAEMPLFVVRKITAALNDERKSIRGSRILVLGIAYKRDVDDMRESPALEILRLLQELGAEIAYHDPYCPVIGEDLDTPLEGLPIHSTPLSSEMLAATDAVVVVTDHAVVDYESVGRHAPLVVDTRGVMRKVGGEARVVSLSGA